MTPQERELIADLFERLAALEGQERDPDAEREIAEGLARAPNAVYPLVQTVLVQDEALKAANARIEELQGGGDAVRPSGFLDSMRGALFRRGEERHGSVPSVRPGSQSAFSSPAPQSAYAQSYPQAPSFLGTAAAAAAGMIGGALLLDGIRSMLGGARHGPFAQTFQELNAGPGASPWNDDLARQAGRDDVGRPEGTPQGLVDEQPLDPGEQDFADDGGFDDGELGDGGGGTDFA
jgi:uncharacterized protein